MKPKTRAAVPAGMLRNRFNKTAQGMTATIQLRRHSGRLSAAAVTLSVRGTLDKLRDGIVNQIYRIAERKACPCCGSKTGLLALNDRGRDVLTRKNATERAAKRKGKT